MKKRNLFYAFAAALAMTVVGCSQEDLPDVNTKPDVNNPKDVAYMNVTVALPTGNGSRADDGATEVGKDYENEVNSVILVMAEKQTNKFIACAEKYESLTKSQDGTKVTAVQSVAKSALSEYYGGENGTLTADKQEINIFVFCNPTSDLRTYLTGLKSGNAEWVDKTASIAESPNGVSDNSTIWGGPENKGGFLMSSYEIATKKLPANFVDWNKYTKASNPFHLSGKNTDSENTANDINNGGAIKVERSVARFDFKDGSNGDNTYDVIKDAEKVLVKVQLQKMSLVNMSKNFYYLRRVSDDGTNTNWTIGGAETSSNYVVDTDSEKKKKDGDIITQFEYADHFNFALGHSTIAETNKTWTIDEDARKQWYTSKLSDVLKETAPDDNPDWGGTATHGNYKIWRYVTENTIPETNAQQNGISTGIVFQGQMLATDNTDSELANALKNATGNSNEDAILYVFDKQKIYVRWTAVRAHAIEAGPGDPLYEAAFGATTVTPVAAKAAQGETSPAVEAVYSDDVNSPDYKWNEWHNKNLNDEAKLKEFKKSATGKHFTLYQSSKVDGVAGYYCFYYYWNRHRDNNNNGVMAPMEFAVVRNNVYKLAVNSIRQLGHPRLSENDPDPVDPEDPDEEGDIYFDVAVQALPWTVKVNNIDF